MSAVPAPDSSPDAGAIWHYGDPFGEQRAAEHDAAVVDRSHRAVLTLTGPDRRSWLHSISSQHVSELPDGTSTENLSLDGQGRVEDHWVQTELDGVTYLDTERSRGEPLLAYLRKMVFWADVTPEAADLAVLSLLGPRLDHPAALAVLGLTELPGESAAVPVPGGGFVRRVPTPPGQIELDLLVPRAAAADWLTRLEAAGVRRAEGRFDKGDAVIVRDEAGREIARGLVRYDAGDAARICGLKSEAIEAALGYTSGPLIHADDLAVA